jgi:carboxyl-terminal processing protease
MTSRPLVMRASARLFSRIPCLLRPMPALALAGALGCAAPTPAHAEERQLTCPDLPLIVRTFERRHYVTNRTDDVIKQRAVERFIRALDPSRTLLLEGEVTKLQAELVAVFDTLKDGGCGKLDAAAAIARQRIADDEKIARALLGDDYKLDESVEIQLDPDKRGYAKTVDDRAALVRRLIHFQMSNLLATKVAPDAARRQLVHRYELAVRRAKDRIAADDLAAIFAEAYAEALDPHSSFISADALVDFQISMSLSLEGIGAGLISDDGMIVLESLVPGGQAEKSGQLRPKDKILAVAQAGEEPVQTFDMELREVVKMIRGPKGTKVTLTILREGKDANTFNVTIERAKIDVKEQAAKIKYETRKNGKRAIKIGVIELPSFYGSQERGARSSYADVKALLEEAKRQKVDGIVLDLSRNGGGLLQDAVRISGLFLREGGMVATRDSGGRRDVLADEDDEVVWSGPLAIMISPISASASEIVAGALHDYGRAIVIGSSHTFGKGTVQTLEQLPMGLGALKITTGMFFVPGGKSTQQVGVSAHVRVPSILDGVDVGEKSLDYTLAPQSTEPFLDLAAAQGTGDAKWTPIGEAEIQGLQQRSKERVAKDPKFAEIKKELDESEKNRGPVKLGELRARARRGSPEREKEDERIKGLDAAFVGEGVNVLADYITIRRG